MFMDPVFLALIMTTTRRKKSASFSLMSSSHGEDPAAASNSMEQSGGVRRRNRKAVDRIWKKGGSGISSQRTIFKRLNLGQVPSVARYPEELLGCHTIDG